MENLNESLLTPEEDIETPTTNKKKALLGIAFASLIIIAALAFWGYKKNADTNAASDLSLSNIVKRGVLVVGSSPPYGPMEFYNEAKEMVGIDVDIAKEIASAIGVELQMKEIDFDSINAMINSGEIDIAIASITITTERMKEVLFSVPYFTGGQIIVARSSDDSINDLTDLNSKKIGVEDDGTSLKDSILKYSNNSLIVPHKDSESDSYVMTVTDELKNGLIDAFVVDYIVSLDLVKNDQALKIIGTPFTEEYYGITTKLGNETLVNKINEVLKKLKQDDKLKTIQDKWTK